MQEESNQPIDSLDALHVRLSKARKDLAVQEERVSQTWNELFHKVNEAKAKRSNASALQRITLMAVDTAEVVDGLIFGWRLYRRLKDTSFNPFKKKKKK